MSSEGARSGATRWFHAIVIVGTSLTAGACGNSKPAQDAAPTSDSGADIGTMSDTSSPSDATDAADGRDGGADAAADANAASDSPIEYPTILIP